MKIQLKKWIRKNKLKNWDEQTNEEIMKSTLLELDDVRIRNILDFYAHTKDILAVYAFYKYHTLMLVKERTYKYKPTSAISSILGMSKYRVRYAKHVLWNLGLFEPERN